MGLYKRGQVWWMDFIYKGKRYRESTNTEDRKQAQRIYDKVKGQIVEGKWFDRLPGEDKTLKEMITKYLTEHSARNKAPRSYTRDMGISKHLTDFFGDVTLTEITPKRITEYKTRRRVAGASPRTVNYELALLGHAFNLAVREWEWCSQNPVQRVSKERVSNDKERWLTLEEEERLLASSPKWLQEIIIFAVNTGLREGEILNLQWTQVDLFRRTITLLGMEQKNRGKDTLPINKAVLQVMKARAKVRHIKSNYVFYNGSGNPYNARNLLRAFYSAMRKAEVHGLRFHDLRHTFATRLVQEGVDVYAVQRLGRWKNISMVMRYAHHYPESLRAGVEVLDRIRHDTKMSQLGEQGEDRGV